MAVRLRLKRMGRKNRAFFRIVAADSRAQRDGRAVEQLGYYDPLLEDEQKKVSIKKERIEYWLSVGAQPSLTVENLLRSRGVKFPKKDAAKAKAKIKAKEQKRKAKKKPQKGKAKPKGSLRKAKKSAAKKAKK